MWGHLAWPNSRYLGSGRAVRPILPEYPRAIHVDLSPARACPTDSEHHAGSLSKIPAPWLRSRGLGWGLRTGVLSEHPGDSSAQGRVGVAARGGGGYCRARERPTSGPLTADPAPERMCRDRGMEKPPTWTASPRPGRGGPGFQRLCSFIYKPGSNLSELLQHHKFISSCACHDKSYFILFDCCS